jgi:hypothetical protein
VGPIVDCPGVEGEDRLVSIAEGTRRNRRGTAVGDGVAAWWLGSDSCSIDKRRRSGAGVAGGDAGWLSSGRSVPEVAGGDAGWLSPCSVEESSKPMCESATSLRAVSKDHLLLRPPGSSVALVMSGGSVSSWRTPKKDRGSFCCCCREGPSSGSSSYAEIKSSSSS